MLRKLCAILLVVTGVGIAGMTFLPGSWVEVTQNVPASGAAPSHQQTVIFHYPHDLPDGEQLLFEMTVPPNGSSAAAAGSPVQLEGRLDLAGVDLFPAEILRVPYRAGQTISFRWLVTAHPGAAENGTIWLVAIGFDSSNQEIRSPMIARPIEVELRQVLGLSYLMARWVGSIMISIGSVCAVWLFIKGKKSRRIEK
jgi:hypothetical protein